MFAQLSDLVNSIREYQLLWKSKSSEDIDGLITRIDMVQKNDMNEEIFIENVNSYPRQYIHALKSLLDSANSELLIFTDQLDQTLADGTPLYSDPKIIDIIKDFLRKDRSHLKIVTRYATTDDFVVHHPLFSELLKFPGFHLYCATSNRVRKCESKCVVVDKKAYNFRVKNFAWMNFNNPDFARKLSLAIERAIRLPTTYSFDLRLAQQP